jgi:hypothetical protein
MPRVFQVFVFVASHLAGFSLVALCLLCVTALTILMKAPTHPSAVLARRAFMALFATNSRKKSTYAMCSVFVCLLLLGFLVGCETGGPVGTESFAADRPPFTGDATALTPSVDSTGHVNQVILERESDCSITEDLLNNPFLTLTFSVAATVPNFQNTLHSRARLTTTPNQFPNGCKDSTQGIASTTAIYLGRTKSGQFIGAGLDFNNALHIGTLDPGSGTISQSQAKVTSVPNPSSLATADLNGDGNNDLIVVDSANTQTGDTGGIYVFLGNGDGTFKTPVSYSAGSSPVAVTIDDVNRDGKLDLIVAGFQSPPQPVLTHGVSVLLGNGDGTFRPVVSSPSRGSLSIAAGDFNGDGTEDIVLGNGDIQLGKGDGTFAATVFTLPLPLGDRGGLPVAGEFNNDSKLDVAVSDMSEPNGIHMFLGKGDGTFTAGPSYAKTRQTPDLTAADLDGDGNLDLVSGLGSLGLFGPDINDTGGVYSVLMGNGDGTLQGAPSYAAVAAPNNMTTISAVNSVSPAFAVGDFDGDGKPDILGASLTATGGSQLFSNGLRLLTGDGKGNFTAGKATTGSTPSIITAADMNGDKKLDAIFVDGPNVAGFASSIGVALGNGDGTFLAVKDYPNPGTGSVQDMVLGDFNGDGKPDVLITTAGATSGPFSTTYLFLNNGNGILAVAKEIDTPVSGLALAAADLNGDGKLDFVATNTDNDQTGTPGSMLVYLGNGDGTFAAPVTYTLPEIAPGPVAIADMNKDGKPDILVISRDQAFTTATFSIFHGKGDGTFGSPINATLPDTAFSNLAVADIDGDGNQDAVVGGCCGLAFTKILLGNGDGTIKSQYALALGASSQSVTTADVNGDNHPDLLLVSGNAVEVFLNLYGSATTGSPTSTSLSLMPNPAAVGQAVTFTAQVSASASGMPTGTVTFLNGTTQLGTGTLDGSAQATFSTSILAAGSYAVTATYGGDSKFAESMSTATTLTVGTAGSSPDFSLATGAATLMIARGKSGTDTISITPVNGFNQPTAFACSGLPSGAACSFSPATVTPNGTVAGTTTMTITTTAPSSSRSSSSPWPFAGGSGAFALGLIFLRGRKRLPSLLCLVLLLGMGGIVFGCGGSSHKPPTGNAGTPAGTSTVTITAAGSSANPVSHTTTVALTVQ